MNDWESAAREHVDASIASVEFELAALITKGDVQAAYDPKFIAKCALLDENALFDAKRRLKSLKGFEIREWQRRIQTERETVTRPVRAAVGWETLLIRNDEGSVKSILANAITALRDCPDWSGVLAYNQFSCRTTKRSPPPYGGCGEWTDVDDIKTAEWLQRHGILVGTGVAAEAVQAVAAESAFHPVRAYLDRLEWDEQPRIQNWLTSYMGVEPTEYTRAIGPKWLISAVARVMNPGCQVDSCIILEGLQGMRKSTALRVLAGDDWFTDQISALDHKDSSGDLAGKWIIEFSDLAHMSKTEAGVLKCFITRRIDHYRQPYGRRSADFPRQCVFCASTNQQTYLVDETGGRRWWPIACTAIDIRALREDRDQLWAEAVHEWRHGRAWWLEDQSLLDDAENEQASRYDEDMWDNVLWQWVISTHDNWPGPYELDRSNRDQRPAEEFFMSTEDILEYFLNKKTELWTNADRQRIGRILRVHKMIRYKKRLLEGFQWRYRFR